MVAFEYRFEDAILRLRHLFNIITDEDRRKLCNDIEAYLAGIKIEED